MGEIHRLPDLVRTEREAADWFARFKADDVTAADRAGFVDDAVELDRSEARREIADVVRRDRHI